MDGPRAAPSEPAVTSVARARQRYCSETRRLGPPAAGRRRAGVIPDEPAGYLLCTLISGPLIG